MAYAIVEGEPGIFPDPVARVLRGIGRLFRPKRRDEAPPPDRTDRDDERGEPGDAPHDT